MTRLNRFSIRNKKAFSFNSNSNSHFFSVSLRFLNLPSEDTVFCSLSIRALVWTKTTNTLNWKSYCKHIVNSYCKILYIFCLNLFWSYCKQHWPECILTSDLLTFVRMNKIQWKCQFCSGLCRMAQFTDGWLDDYYFNQFTFY